MQASLQNDGKLNRNELRRKAGRICDSLKIAKGKKKNKNKNTNGIVLLMNECMYVCM